ncbi:hypothetical protein [Thiocapsa sp.]|uniref:hypothetical protein n=1 Tax=Thiocapsa sp. TaxID=2024551 RepID=UPI002BFABD56|nr:hypothetical protein [Thiocapsa sp.]HSO81922.1 hypothetical protein [Thiocapsa sp.]
MRFAVSTQLEVHATCRYSDYESQCFLGRLSDGTVREIFTSDPTLQEVGIGMRWSW